MCARPTLLAAMSSAIQASAAATTASVTLVGVAPLAAAALSATALSFTAESARLTAVGRLHASQGCCCQAGVLPPAAGIATASGAPLSSHLVTR
jgi:CO dehydrogenase nickel-insertion accessory protein CooC1